MAVDRRSLLERLAITLMVILNGMNGMSSRLNALLIKALLIAILGFVAIACFALNEFGKGLAGKATTGSNQIEYPEFRSKLFGRVPEEARAHLPKELPADAGNIRLSHFTGGFRSSGPSLMVQYVLPSDQFEKLRDEWDSGSYEHRYEGPMSSFRNGRPYCVPMAMDRNGPNYLIFFVTYQDQHVSAGGAFDENRREVTYWVTTFDKRPLPGVRQGYDNRMEYPAFRSKLLDEVPDEVRAQLPMELPANASFVRLYSHTSRSRRSPALIAHYVLPPDQFEKLRNEWESGAYVYRYEGLMSSYRNGAPCWVPIWLDKSGPEHMTFFVTYHDERFSAGGAFDGNRSEFTYWVMRFGKQ